MISLTFLLFSFQSFSRTNNIEVGIDEQLGNYLPLDTSFKDENGNELTLREMLVKPTVLSFVYYNCPGICSPLLMEIADVVNKSDLVLGVDYNIINISMDQFETPEIALSKKGDFLQLVDKQIPAESWRFLTGDSTDIKNVADAAGFYYKRQGKDFLHTGALIFIDTEGKVCRYLFPAYSDSKGFGIAPFDFKMAVLEAAQGRVSPTIARVLQYCFSYDPQGKTYVLSFTRIFGAGILILVAVFAIIFLRKPKNLSKK
jgi:protein SCO1/2